MNSFTTNSPASSHCRLYSKASNNSYSSTVDFPLSLSDNFINTKSTRRSSSKYITLLDKMYRSASGQINIIN